MSPRARSAAGLAAALAGAVFFVGCPDKVPVGPELKLPDQVVERFTLDQTDEGEPVFRLKAERATVYDSEGRVEVLQPVVSFFDEDRSIYSTMTADSGTIFSKTEDLVARGHVRIETKEGTRLATDSLSWSSGQRSVRTDAPVVIDTKNGHVEGQGLVSDAGLERIRILSEVRGTGDYDIRP